MVDSRPSRFTRRVLVQCNLVAIPFAVAFLMSYSFLDEIPVYLNWFGFVLLFFGSCYIVIGLFWKGNGCLWRRFLQITGIGLFLLGLLSVICYYNFLMPTMF